jgi:Domain of unknown function (DUF1735).
MKPNLIFKFTLMTIALWLQSCSKVIVYEPSDEEIAQYTQLYMPRAERGINTSSISITGEPVVLTYNAYMGGPSIVSDDVPVVFSVDSDAVAAYNEANGTHYNVFPSEGYELEASNAVIKAGSRTTGNFRLTVTPGNHLKLFENYLLPLRIAEAGAKINERLSVTYYAFSVGYAPGQVPRELVLSLGTDWGNILSNGARGSLIRRNTANDILVYMPDADGKFTDPPRTVATNWDASESFYYVNETALVVRNYPYWAGLFSFRIDEDHGLPQAAPFWLGDFWDRYVIVPYRDYFLTIDADGIIRRQGAFTDVNAPKTEIASGFPAYKQVLSYQNNALLALEENGNLWYYPMSELAVPAARKQVGSGWDMYEKIIVSGADILALDGAGDIYRYRFNPSGFFPLK